MIFQEVVRLFNWGSCIRSGLVALLFVLLGCQVDEHASRSQDPDWTMRGFIKVDSLNPILTPNASLEFRCPIRDTLVNWEERNVLNPAAVVKDDIVHLIYRAQDRYLTSRLGLATSRDGLHFTKHPAPIFYPEQDNMQVYEWPGGVEDPRIVESEDGMYVLTYTAYDGKTARLCLATSQDLQTWTKHGLVLGDEKYRDTWSKSGAIVSRMVNHRIVATKIQGRYWMYFGDTDLFLATSNDLINWEIAENSETREMISVLQPRMGYFDSRLVEPGPPPLLQDEGILLIYNGSNAANFNDPHLPVFTYAAGQALFDKNNPYKLISRTDHYFIYPDKEYERVGEVHEVCFVEGLVYFNGHWLLYYGTADSKIAVAMK